MRERWPLPTNASLCPELNTEIPDLRGTRDAVRQYKFRWPTLDRLHASFDLRHPNPLIAGAIVAYLGEWPKKQGEPDRASTDDLYVGLALTYADLINEAKLAEALPATKLSPALQDEFKSLIKRRAQVLEQYAAQMSASKRSIFVDLPRRTTRTLVQELNAMPQLGNQLDALIKRADLVRSGTSIGWQELATELDGLRRSVHQACGATEECTYHSLYIEATYELTTLYTSVSAREQARAESSLLTRKHALKNRFQGALSLAVTGAASKANEAYRKRESNQKLDPKLASSVPPGLHTEGVTFLSSETSMPFLASALDKGSVNAHMTEAVVAARSVKGKEAQIDFKTEYVDIDEPYDCLRTNRIERIGSDGRVEYETDCKYRKIREARSRLDSVWVKVEEAHALKPGDLVSFWQTKDKAAIVFVRGEKGKTLVQVRGDRVKQGGP